MNILQRKPKYYSLAKILKAGADYNIIFGERSNGKTYALLEHALRTYLKTGKQSAYVRRWREDLRGKRAETLFSGLVANGTLEKLTKGKYNEIFYYTGKWFLSNYNAETKKRVPSDDPFCYAFSLSETEHDKSTSYPNITTVIFDEFLTRKYYLTDEFVIFMNLLSTIIRQRDNVKIFMLGNTVNKYCPYFSEMGLNHIRQQEQGSIDIYKFGETGATVAVEYAASMESTKESNKYFCFDNSRLQMITGGKWELSLYPHLPTKYVPANILFKYYIVYKEYTLTAEIIQTYKDFFTYIHYKTTPIRGKQAVVFALDEDGVPYHFVKIISSATKIQTRIARFFATNKVFYQNNEVGEIVRNYILESSKKQIV